MKLDPRSWMRRAGGATPPSRERIRGIASTRPGGLWPRAAYRFAWGPSARPVVQGIFAAACELSAGRPEVADLQDSGILARDTDPSAADVPIAELERLLDRAHGQGVAGLWRSYRALARAVDGSLRFRDLRGARAYRRGSIAFASARDLDTREFNRQFGAALLTEAGARQILADLRARVPEAFQRWAGLDLGMVRPGRVSRPGPAAALAWETLEGPLVGPLVAGKRVLDLASSPVTFPLMLLGAGAGEVVAIVQSPEAAEVLRAGAQVMSWRDIRRYPLRILTGGLRALLTNDTGRFDVVTACGSLTHLQEEEAARILHRAAGIGAVLIVQADEQREADAPGTATLYRLLRENGCPDITVHAPDGLSRPLLVGYPYAAAGARYRGAAARG